MAVAGKAAITLDGAWSSTKAYDRLTGVTYNNSLFISRKKPPIGTAPSEGEYWMLCIEGVNEKDLDALKERVVEIENNIDDLGAADISEIGDGTVKGAIKEHNDTRQLTNYINISDIGLDAATVTFADFVEKIPENSMYAHSIWKNSMSNFEFPDGCGDYCYLIIFKGTTAYVNALLMDLNNNRVWNKARYGGVTTAWNSYLPLTGGTLSGSELQLLDGWGYIHSGTADFQINIRNAKNDNSNMTQLLLYNSAMAALKDRLRLVDFAGGVNKHYALFGEHNKPTGSYIGNGSATARAIDTGGTGNFCLIKTSTTFVMVYENFAIDLESDGSIFPKAGEVTFYNGILTIYSDKNSLNYSGSNYSYAVI